MCYRWSNFGKSSRSKSIYADDRMTNALTHYEAVHASILSFRRRMQPAQGLDALAARMSQRLSGRRFASFRSRGMAGQATADASRYTSLADKQIEQRLAVLREVFSRRRADDATLIEALALLGQVIHRQFGVRLERDPLHASILMYRGHFIESADVATRSWSAALAAVLFAWTCPVVHIVKCNELAAEHDVQEMLPFYQWAGLSCACVLARHSVGERSVRFRHNVVYTTARILVGDWLRDQLRGRDQRDAVLDRLAPLQFDGADADGTGQSPAGPSQVIVPGLDAAIIDDVDTILIDFATAPLSISTARHADQTPQGFEHAAQLARRLVEDEHYQADADLRTAKLTRQGQRKLADLLATEEAVLPKGALRSQQLIEQALTASLFYERGRHYEVVEDRVILTDEQTGKHLTASQIGPGLQQAVEAKEGVEITCASRELSNICFQEFFNRYRCLTGCAPSLADCRGELQTSYGRPVSRLRHRTGKNRKQFAIKVLKSTEASEAAILDQAGRLLVQGDAVLISVTTKQACDRIAACLSAHGLRHQTVVDLHTANALESVARIIEPRSVTIMLNTAGAGSNLVLPADGDRANALHVIVAQSQYAARLNRRILGWSGNMHSRGESFFFLSLDDPLLARHLPVVVKWLSVVYRKSPEPLRLAAASFVFAVARKRAQQQARSARRWLVRQSGWLDQYLPSR